MQTPHETGHVDRIAGFCERGEQGECGRARCAQSDGVVSRGERGGRPRTAVTCLDALAISRPPAALFWLLVVALDLANSAGGGTHLEHVPRVRRALAVLRPIGARLLDVTAEQRARAARVHTLLLHEDLVLAVALAVLGPRAA